MQNLPVSYDTVACCKLLTDYLAVHTVVNPSKLHKAEPESGNPKLAAYKLAGF